MGFKSNHINRISVICIYVSVQFIDSVSTAETHADEGESLANLAIIQESLLCSTCAQILKPAFYILW